jgi:hypothetical protein
MYAAAVITERGVGPFNLELRIRYLSLRTGLSGGPQQVSEKLLRARSETKTHP